MTEVRIVLKEMNRNAVTPDVTGDVLLHPCPLGMLLNDIPRGVLVDGLDGELHSTDALEVQLASRAEITYKLANSLVSIGVSEWMNGTTLLKPLPSKFL